VYAFSIALRLRAPVSTMADETILADSSIMAASHVSDPMSIPAKYFTFLPHAKLVIQ
jgi:hypothetical protein